MRLILYILLLTLLNLNMSYAEPARAPDFSLPTASNQVSNQDFRGKVIYLDFWASWCHPCRQLFPWLNELNRKYSSQGLEIIAINLDQDRAKAEQFLKLIPADFTIAYDPEAITARDYRARGLPTSYLIDRNGVIRNQHAGFREKDKSGLELIIIDLLNEKTTSNQ